MKHIIFTIAVLGLLVSPRTAAADELSYQEAWKFYYLFSLRSSGGTLAETDRYHLTTAMLHEPVPGAWRVTSYGSNGTMRDTYRFDPVAMAAADGGFQLTIPQPDDGAKVVFEDANGVTRLTIDTSDSRVCNDDGTCDSRVGENMYNCPLDCGSAASAGTLTTAAIGAPLAQIVGGVALRISLAATGLFLLAAVALSLDTRRRP
jgi:hypothetical protein